MQKTKLKISVSRCAGCESGRGKNSFSDYLEIFLLAGCLLFLLFLADQMNFSRFFPDISENTGIAIAFLIGIIASVSTCLTLVGGIVMSFGSVVGVEGGRADHFLKRGLPHFYFHLGRIGGYALFGGILGLIGGRLNYSPSLTGYLTAIVALVMLYIGLRILNILPQVALFGFRLPSFLSSRIEELLNSKHHLMPVIIGALTFFLPCGFTQSMQLAAIGSQNFFTGALIMAAFALGTMPVLLAIGIGSTYASREKFGFFKHLIGVVIIFFALFSLKSGLILAGFSYVPIFSVPNQKIEKSQLSADLQVIKMDVDWVYSPSEFTLKKGIPVRWEIRGINVTGCSNELVVPSLNIRKSIVKGLNIIEFTPVKSGIIPFSCSMGMIGGKFVVE